MNPSVGELASDDITDLNQGITNSNRVELSVISETFNIKEGTDWNLFRSALRAAISVVSKDSGEVLVTDVCDTPQLAQMLAQEFPNVRRVVATGEGYDAAKMRAAQEASGRYLLYLDSDCIPATDWHQHMLAALRSGKAIGYGGYSRYAGGFIAAVLSVMDFGFLYPKVSRDLACYAFNNTAFLRSALLSCPVRSVELRCNCFSHAQQLYRRGTPMRLVPEAGVLHALPPFWRERTRQGHDIIKVRERDPLLPQARWLRLGMLSVPLFYALAVALDWKRMWMARRDLGLSYWQWALSFFLFPFFRLVDARGMISAFAETRTRAIG